MIKDINSTIYETLKTNIQEGGGLYNLEEIIDELTKFKSNFDTHSMNERTLFLEGQKDMLNKIIKYLERCL